MITDKVIQEIYRKYRKPPKHKGDLKLGYFLNKLKENHHLIQEDNEVINYDMEEFNPFRRFLIRNLNAILELDKIIAFVFPNHILFFDKYDNEMRVHIKAESVKPNFFQRLFGH